jgi:hypothetical protein
MHLTLQNSSQDQAESSHTPEVELLFGLFPSLLSSPTPLLFLLELLPYKSLAAKSLTKVPPLLKLDLQLKQSSVSKSHKIMV